MTARLCAAPGCDNPVPRPARPGRPPIYCNPTCRPSATPRPAITIDIDHDDDATNGIGWSVTLRRGHRAVTVANNLGRFSATLLRDDLQQLLHPTREEGAPNT